MNRNQVPLSIGMGCRIAPDFTYKSINAFRNIITRNPMFRLYNYAVVIIWKLLRSKRVSKWAKYIELVEKWEENEEIKLERFRQRRKRYGRRMQHLLHYMDGMGDSLINQIRVFDGIFFSVMYSTIFCTIVTLVLYFITRTNI